MSPWTLHRPDQPRPAALGWLWLAPLLALALALTLAKITRTHEARGLVAAEAAR